MGLEAATLIHQLDPANPVGGSDPKSQGDDHIRLLKTTIQNTFANVDGAVTSSHTELNKLTGVTATTAELNKLAGLTATTAELNKLAGTAAGLTAVELSILDGLTATTAELNKLAGVAAGLTAAELSFVDGVTSNIQTQLDAFKFRTVFKAAATARASTTTYTNDPDLVHSNVPAGTYEIDMVLFFTGVSNTPGYKAQINFTGTVADALLSTQYTQAGNLFAQANSFAGGNVLVIASATVFSAGAGVDGVVVKGTVTLSNTNTVALQWAQNSSNASATNLLQMSRFSLRRTA